MEGTTKSAPKRKRAPRKVKDGDDKRKYKSWGQGEETSILDYMKDTIRNGRKIEKPSADQYYQNIVNAKGIDATAIQVKNKVRNMKEGYLAAVNWRNNTGVGVMEAEGPESVLAQVIKRCPYFESLDEIYATNLSLQPLCFHDSDNVDRTDQDELEFELMGDQENMVQVWIPESPPLVQISEIYSEDNLSPIIPSISEDDQRTEISQPVAESLRNSNVNKPKEKQRAICGLKEKLITPPARKKAMEKSNGLEALAAAQTKRQEAIDSKIQVEKQRLDLDMKTQEEKLLLERQRLAFEQKRHEDVQTLKQEEISSNERIMLAQIQSEERIAKFRIEQEFKVNLVQN